ncbi:hypothetical protein [Nocardioides hungaricus]
MTTLLVGVVALLALLLPGLRDQLALSATHRQQEYVALSFARGDDGTVATCERARGRLRVGFVVTSALPEARELGYVVAVGDSEVDGRVTVAPGESAGVARVVPLPRERRFDVEVRLPAEDRRIRAHCGGAGS